MVPTTNRSESAVSSTCGSFCATRKTCFSRSIAAVMAAIDVRRPTERGTISLGKTTSSRSGTSGSRRVFSLPPCGAASAVFSLPPCGGGSGWGVFSSAMLELRLLVRDGGPERLGDRGAAFQGPRPDQPHDLVFFEHLFLQQRGGEGVQLGAVGAQDRLRRLKSLGEHPGDFFVDDGRRPLADVRIAGQLSAEEDRLRRVVEGEQPHLLAHPPADHHPARQLGRGLEVVLRPGGDAAQRNLLGGTSASAMAIRACRYSSDRLCRSSVGIDWVTPSACPRGTMVILCTGSDCGWYQATSAWPDSW